MFPPRVCTCYAPTSGADEVQADVQPAVVVGAQRAFDLELLLEVSLELRVDIVHHSLEAVFFVHLVAVADCVADG